MSHLNELLQGINTVKSVQSDLPRLVEPWRQQQLIQQSIGQPLGNSPYAYGPAVFNHFVRPPVTGQPHPINLPTLTTSMSTAALPNTLFYQNYLNQQRDAAANHAALLKALSKQAESWEQARNSPCVVLPPLFVRYSGSQDEFIPCRVLDDGELQRDDAQPDLILNFHADTRSITCTICSPKKQALKGLEIAVSALYSMFGTEHRLDVGTFGMLYDAVRAQVLKQRGLVNHESFYRK